MREQRSATVSVLLRHAPVVLLSALYLYGVGRPAVLEPLWLDEIFTYTVANLESPIAIVRALLDNADIHPPLDYLARHLSMALFGVSEFAFRLPSVIALLVASLSLYAFVLRRCSLLPALVAFTFPLSTIALGFAYEGRAYAFWLASMCLSLLAWQLAAEKPSILRLGFLTASLCLGPFSYYYGVLNYTPIIAGEAWRNWERRKICWPIVVAVVLSFALLAFLVPFAMNASKYSAAFWTDFGPFTPFRYYATLMARSFPPLMASLIVCSALIALWPGHESARRERPGLRQHEVIAALVLCIVPFLAYFLAEFVTGALKPKYTLTTIVGATLLIAFLTHRVEAWRRPLAFAIALCFCLWTAGMLVNHAIKAPGRAAPVSDDVIALIDSAEIPIVMADPNAFLTAHTYLSEDRRRKVFYPTDRKSALKYSRFDTAERALTNLRRFTSINVVDLCDFTNKHRRFFLIRKRSDWFVRTLLDGSVPLKLLSSERQRGSIYKVDLGAWNGCK